VVSDKLICSLKKQSEQVYLAATRKVTVFEIFFVELFNTVIAAKYIRRIPNHAIEAARFHRVGEFALPVKRIDAAILFRIG
jgi:hypothetical protein